MNKMDSYKIDKLLQPILRQMEKVGVKLDISYLAKLSEKVWLELSELEDTIYERIGHKFNLNSPSQLAKVLYRDLKIKPSQSGVRRGKTHHSTNAESLKKVKHLHPAIEKILKYRELAKLKNTYIDPLPKLVDENDHLHTHYAVDTSSGRLSSKNPNLQNIPIRTELGSQIRQAFIAESGYKLLKADYSQVELRIAAHLSNDKNMIAIFNAGRDIHAETAIELGCDRRTAKVVNFGILYGISSYGLAQTLKIPPEEAQIYIDRYFLTYPDLKKYCDNTINSALKNGYVETLYGRKRQLPELKSPIDRVRNFGRRAATNTPIQGTAADIIKLAMLALNKQLTTYNSQQSESPKKLIEANEANKLILQIHDELVLEVIEDKITELAKIVKDAMENVVKLKVPLIVDLEVGKNWKDTEEIKV